jgi:prophage maintenance system killer protein
MPPEPPVEFLDLEDVLGLHRASLNRWGGLDGIRDQGALEAAIAQPQATFDGEYLHEDLFSMAAAYAFHVGQARRLSTATSAPGCSRPSSSST